MTNINELQPVDGGGWTADYQWKWYRFLLSDGRTFDVRAVEDGSWLRMAVLKTLGWSQEGKDGRIEGVAILEGVGVTTGERTLTPTAAKRVAKKVGVTKKAAPKP